MRCSKEVVAKLDYVLSDALTLPEKCRTERIWTSEIVTPRNYLRVLSAGRFCESRMRAILTSGSTRGEDTRLARSPSLLLYLEACDTPCPADDIG
jgi:hypothetical protein